MIKLLLFLGFLIYITLNRERRFYGILVQEFTIGWLILYGILAHLVILAFWIFSGWELLILICIGVMCYYFRDEIKSLLSTKFTIRQCLGCYGVSCFSCCILFFVVVFLIGVVLFLLYTASQDCIKKLPNLPLFFECIV